MMALERCGRRPETRARTASPGGARTVRSGSRVATRASPQAIEMGFWSAIVSSYGMPRS